MTWDGFVVEWSQHIQSLSLHEAVLVNGLFTSSRARSPSVRGTFLLNHLETLELQMDTEDD